MNALKELVRKDVQGQELVSINIVQKHQEAIFLLDTATTSGHKVDPIYVSSWKESLEGQLGRC